MSSIVPQLQATQRASAQVRRLSDAQKADLLRYLADLLLKNSALIQAENQKDMDLMADRNDGTNDPKKDRLFLNQKRIEDLANSLRDVAKLPDPSGQVAFERTIEQGLQLKKMMVPMGVVGVIYESRPNVTVDVAALCLRSGNACVLKGGKEADFSNRCLVGLIHEALAQFGIDKNAVLLLPTDRQFITELLTATRCVDLIIPRGSDALIQFVRQNSLIPTIETGAGVCHGYVEASAHLPQARDMVVNARVSRPSVCNSMDCVLIDSAIAAQFLPLLKADFIKWNVEIFADAPSYPIFEAMQYPFLQRAQPQDFGREFLDYKMAVKIVSGLEEALDHIQNYSSRHSEAIYSTNQVLIDRFLAEVDAAAVYANASTRFTDGAVFGLGAEIGISTQKLHARGPFALEKLVTEKWIVTGNGQMRW
ncbi:MAG: glutamate-5-semialdehyde dehydrogenase [Runella slithyformis]|nr:MAG: glutamate-5-semialdehyde dehydrogenase [Runella slithyformis]TAF25456.1 MAG: glutamate-5-semialdehyde dehydrogenase [Runella slithyformis]TAF43733.1 MAG: glutamate-5-semialdehyde dehydrogenase [Runella slithyformis]TAF79843.1 MAG: glutamate-5-semialdehyde dehydrogenase [Runella slithyformis]